MAICVTLIFQVNMIKEDGTVIHFLNPKVQASLSANTFAVTGQAETKSKLLITYNSAIVRIVLCPTMQIELHN